MKIILRLFLIIIFLSKSNKITKNIIIEISETKMIHRRTYLILIVESSWNENTIFEIINDVVLKISCKNELYLGIELHSLK